MSTAAVSYQSCTEYTIVSVFFGNLVGSLFFAAILSKCQFAFIGLNYIVQANTYHPDDGLMVSDPYASYVRAFAM